MVRKSYNFLLLAFISIFFSVSVIAQSTIWSDNFNNGCASNCLANTWNGWTILNNIDGISGSASNNWFVSCAEEGLAPPSCGSSCINDQSLHIGANAGAGGDMGASFNETGATNATFKLVVSPTINTTGFSTNTLNFDFIAFGSSACSDDRAELRLSTDNGATWPVGFRYCLTSVCCGACNGYSQGQWTLFTLPLPPAFNNNPNVRVAFHWRNNGNGSGTDPSVAIDDVNITTIPLAARLINFSAREENHHTKLSWTTADEVQMRHFVVEKGDQPDKLAEIGTISPKGNGSSLEQQYSFLDNEQLVGTKYYRLKMVDQNGSNQFSNVLRMTAGESAHLDIHNIVQNQQGNNLEINVWASEQTVLVAELHDMQGRIASRIPNQNLIAGKNKLNVDLSKIASANYLLVLQANGKGFEPIKISRKVAILH